MSSYTQNPNSSDDTSMPSSEVKLNALFLVVGAFEVSYEHLLNEESGLGIDVFIPFDEDITDELNYYISPYYRLYFGKKYAAGFFLEGFAMLNSYNEVENFIIDDLFGFTEERESKTNFALGIGLGGKWVTSRGFLGELGFGVGRNLFNSSNNGSEFVGKVGITLGYRF